MSRLAIRRALIGVYDKTGLGGLATALVEAGVEIVSTGGTARRLQELSIEVTPVEAVTGFPETLDGRVKTLHPAVHAGILADRRRSEHVAALADLGIAAFDLVVVNLYPFRETVASGVSSEECVEQIDIGGPAMLRAAAKNHASVAVVVDPGRYGEVLTAVTAGGFALAERQALAADAFRHTASYDIAVASWMGNVLAPDASGFPNWAAGSWERQAVLRYGENPHQSAALYRHRRPGLAHADQLHGKDMSYNNYVDCDAALRAAFDHADPCVAIIKHANPCGVALGADVAEAHRKAHACDPASAFGGVIAVNREVDLALAQQVAEIFTEVVVAPGFSDQALTVLTEKKNVRLLRMPPADAPAPMETRAISGGLLMQTVDRLDAPGDDPATWTLACGPAAGEMVMADLVFAWRAVRAVKSNAILLADDRATVGIGMGQVNRVDSARLAVSRAGERSAGSVAASDAFFPFADGLTELASAGVRAVVAPGGSVRDAEVIQAAAAAGITMYLTRTRHFLH